MPKVDSNIAGMRQMADKSLAKLVESVDQMTEDYLEAAQPVVNSVSQRIKQMVSGDLLFSAVAHNLEVLMAAEVEMVDTPALGKQTLKPLSFELLEAAEKPKPANYALKPGENTPSS